MKKRFASKQFFKGKSAWIKIVASYFAIMIFSLVVISAVSVYSYRQIKKEIIDSNTMKLGLVKGQFDSTFSQMEQLWRRMCGNKELLALKDVQKQTGGYYIAVSDFIYGTTFDDRVHENENSFEYYFYIENGDMIITRSNSIDSYSFFECDVKDMNIDYNEWRTRFFEQTGKRIVRLTGNDGGDVVYFIYPIPFSRVNKPDIVLVTYINEKELFSNGKSLFGSNEESVCIFDQNGEPVITKGDWSEYTVLPDISGSDIKVVSENGYTSLFTQSGIGGYAYAVKVKNSEFMAKLKPVITFIIIAFLFYLIIGGMLVVFASKRSYMPIKELLSLVFGSDNEQDAGLNEFDIIKSRIMKNIEEYSKVKNEFLAHRIMSRSIAVSELMFDRLHEEKLMSMYPDLYRRLSESFTVLVVKGNGFEDVEYRPATVTEKNLIADLLQKQLGDRHIAFTEDVNDNIIFVVAANGDYRKDIEIAAVAAQEYLSREFGIDIYLALGRVQSEPRKLRDSYFEAIFALSTAHNAGKPVCYESLDSTRLKITYQFSPEYEKEIFDSICCGDTERANMYIRQLYKLNTFAGDASFVHIRILSYGLLAILLKALNLMENVPQEIAELIYKTAGSIGESKAEDARDSIIGIAQMVCGYNEKAGDGKIAERAVKIIESEYGDPGLCCGVIAERLQVNAKHLSRLVKAGYNRGIPEIIAERRISEAKKMLMFGMNVEKVAECTGFSNTRNFRRVFIKYVGMTPKEYKTGIEE